LLRLDIGGANQAMVGIELHGDSANANAIAYSADMETGFAGSFFKAEINSVTKFTLAADGTITLCDDADIVVGSTNGTMIGTAASQKIGFWGVAPVIQPAGADQADQGAMTAATLTDNSGGGATDNTIGAITQVANAGSADVGPTADAIAELADEINKLVSDVGALDTLLTAVRTALVNSGIMKGAE
ncbi:MAG: hypothetical protein ABID40_03620, partial [Candidatus Bipolaricaulota bacterium]